MNFVRCILLVFVIGSIPPLNAQAQPTQSSPRKNPYDKIDEALKSVSRLSLESIREKIEKLISAPPETASDFLFIAELMKRVGDSRTEKYYENAINRDQNALAEDEPAYELFYADYLRNFRGPQRPLFPPAERHYFQALRMLKELKHCEGWDDITRRRVERGLVALYQEDGLPLFSRPVDESLALQQPVAFLGTINKAAQLTGDFDNLDDVRALTSEALLAIQRRGFSISDTELSNMIRRKDQVETLDRVRFRYQSWPVLDIFYKRRSIEQAQITDFRRPTHFNDFNLKEYGIALEKPFSMSKNLDVYLRGAYERTIRQGLIETLPEAIDNVNQYEAKVAISHFLGPDKLVAESTYVFQDISLQIPNRYKRDRRIVAATFTYQRLRSQFQSLYNNHFDARGQHFFAGYTNDKETFNTSKVNKSDYFVGASLKGVGRFDVTVQPTFFTAFVEGEASRRENSQYRTNANLLYRIRDEEKEPQIPEKDRWLYPAFVHIVVPFKHDLALKGLDKFENYKIGIELHTKLYSVKLGRASVLASCGYNYQGFYQLNKTLHLLNASVSLGY